MDESSPEGIGGIKIISNEVFNGSPRYEIQSPIGNNKGNLYEILDRKLNNKLAGKILDDSEGMIEPNEHIITAGKTHPNIVRVYGTVDVNIAGKREKMLLMEFLEPKFNLANIIYSQPDRFKDKGTLLSFIRQSVSALNFLHSNDGVSAVKNDEGEVTSNNTSITHADIKPANIFFTGDDFVKIIDLDSAAGSDPSDYLRAEGIPRVTVGYYAPESVPIDPSTSPGTEDMAYYLAPITPATDQFELAMVLYEVIIRKNLLPSRNHTEYRSYILDENKFNTQKELSIELLDLPLRSTGLKQPKVFIDAISKMLSWKAEERYPTLNEAFEDIQKAF